MISQAHRDNRILLILLVVIALALRLWNLASGTLELDEGYSILIGQHSFIEIFSRGATDSNPPLSNALFHAWARLAGGSEFGWELLSVIAAGIAIYLMAGTSRLLLGASTAIPAALLLTISLYHLDISQKIRIYSWALVFMLLSIRHLYCFVASNSKSSVWYFIASNLILLNLHYYGVLISAALFVWAIFTSWHQVELRNRVLAAFLMIGVLNIPTFYVLYEQYTHYRSFDWIAPPSAFVLFAIWVALGGFSLISALGITTLLVLGIRRQRERGEFSSALLLLILMILPMGLSWGLSLVGSSLFHFRYSIFMLIPYLMLASAGIARLPRLVYRQLVCALLIASFIMPYVRYNQDLLRDGSTKELFRYLQSHVQASDLVLHTSKCSFAPALFYNPGIPEMYFLEGSQQSNVFKYWYNKPAQLALSAAHNYPRLWLFSRPCEGDPTLADIEKSSAFEDLATTLEWKGESNDSALRLYRIGVSVQGDRERRQTKDDS